jgi:hypothetical protein
MRAGHAERLRMKAWMVVKFVWLSWMRASMKVSSPSVHRGSWAAVATELLGQARQRAHQARV